MKHISIVIMFCIIVPTLFAQTLNNKSSKLSKDDIVFAGSFESNYKDSVWMKNWGIAYLDRPEGGEIINTSIDGKKALRVSYPKGGIGPKHSGTSFPIMFANLPNEKEGYYKELYLRYYIKFEKGFDFVKGGKLPGLIGGIDSYTRSGGQQPDGTNGWTLRFMWRTGGELVIYAYVPKSNNHKYGSDTWGQDIDCNFKATPGEWICIEEYANVGTAGKDNGKLKVWINGEKKIDLNDIKFWDIENNYGKIGGIYFSTFHGGNKPDWAPKHDSYIQYDAFVAAKKRIYPIKNITK